MRNAIIQLLLIWGALVLLKACFPYEPAQSPPPAPKAKEWPMDTDPIPFAQEGASLYGTPVPAPILPQQALKPINGWFDPESDKRFKRRQHSEYAHTAPFSEEEVHRRLLP